MILKDRTKERWQCHRSFKVGKKIYINDEVELNIRDGLIDGFDKRKLSILALIDNIHF